LSAFSKISTYIAAACFCLIGFGAGVPAAEADASLVDFLREYLGIKYRDVTFDRFIYVAAKRQRLYLIDGDEIVKSYPVSTAKKGIGNKSGTFQTPQGLHIIAEKVGGDLESMSIIKNKMPTGSKANVVSEPRSTDRDLITSRILHLRGLENNINAGEGCDSYSRGIFIHGTHEEGLIGTPASKGCVRMSNADVMDLFDRAEVGIFVVILNN